MAYTASVRFEWDEAKNVANQRKHGVSYEEASKLFADNVDRLDLFDEHHSSVEERFISIARSTEGSRSWFGPNATRTLCASSVLAGRRRRKRACTSHTWSSRHDGRYP
jgi:uncharacterized DUF497 family protein